MHDRALILHPGSRTRGGKKQRRSKNKKLYAHARILYTEGPLFLQSRLINAMASASCGNCASSSLNSRECTQRRTPRIRTGCFRCSIS